MVLTQLLQVVCISVPSVSIRLGKLAGQLILVLSVILSGCTSMQTVDQKKADWQSRIKPGDSVVVYVDSGEILPLTVASMDNEGFSGNSSQGMQHVQWASVLKIEREQVDVVKTAGAAVGTALLVPVVVVLCLAGGCQ
jgi:hypothetical protein